VGYRFIVCDEDGNPPLGLVNRKDINPGLKIISHAPATPRTTTTTPAMATKVDVYDDIHSWMSGA
jgi:hypothetical protein